MSVANGFPQIQGVFFSVFDTKQGSKPLCQVPDGAVQRTKTSEVAAPLIPFDAVKNYVIPKPQLCNRLVSVQVNSMRVVGYPVNVVGNHYERNSFTFNLAFIFDAAADTSPYEGVISRTAKMLRALEEQNRYVSDPGNLVALDSAVEQMFQDLNSFSECQIPIDESNKLDIKLFPVTEAPPKLHGHDVPVFTVKAQSLVDETWDPTLERLLPYINGANSIRRIADLAEADFTLTVKAVQHLVHYGCVVILGIFQFANVYAPTSAVADICDPQIFQEFCYYVYKYKRGNNTNPHGNEHHHHSESRNGGGRNSESHSMAAHSMTGSSMAGSSNVTGSNATGSNATSMNGSTSIQNAASIQTSASGPPTAQSLASSAKLSESGSLRSSLYRQVVGPAAVLSLKQVFQLYTSFNLGVPLSQWCIQNRDLLQDIDLNRFIAFGLLKRLIYRAHTYPLPLMRHRPSRARVELALKSVGLNAAYADTVMRLLEEPVHLDELCNELRAGRHLVTRVLKALGEWSIVNI